MKHFLRLLTFLSLFGTLFIVFSSQVRAETLNWTTKSPMPTPRWVLSAVTAPNGKIYAFGGIGINGVDPTTYYLNNVEEYNSTTDTWAIKTSKPTGDWGMGAALGSDGKIYTFGGYVERSPYYSNINEVYDPTTDTWQTKSPMPTNRYGLAAVATPNGKIYALGGYNNDGSLSTVEEYDLTTDSWTTKSSMLMPTRFFAASIGPDGDIYVFGSFGFEGSTVGRKVQKYDPNSDTWTFQNDMPDQSLRNSATLASNGKIYVLGRPLNDSTFTNVWTYTTSTDSWEINNNLQTPRTYLGLVSTSNGKIYAIGGTQDFNVGLSTVEEATVALTNQFPSAEAGGPYSVSEGGLTNLSGSGSDQDAGDTLIYSWDLDNNGSFETSGQNVTFSAANLDGPSSQTVVLQVCDNHNACATSNATVDITNVAPTVGTITAPTDPTPLNTAINTSATFTDPGIMDTHTAVWDWGDSSTSTGTVTESNGSGSATGSHTYTTAGVYTVSITVTDKDGGSGNSSFNYVVVYDPNPQDFLTGSGKYNSLAGWDVQNAQAQGEVKFGFQAQYNGGSTPTGQTKLKFKNGNLDFSSTSYQWLVVSGTKATLKGNGTINGAGNYTFLVSAIDGSPDLLRFQIKDSSNNVIYDTQAGAGDTADPITTLTSGKIKIH